jgi:hypothetical protein
MNIITRDVTVKKIKWGIVVNNQYIADPSGKTNLMAWTYNKQHAEALAGAHGGKIVDVELFTKEFNAASRDLQRME